MGLVADIYGLSVQEAINLTPKETLFLLDRAQQTFYQLASTSPDMQAILRQRLAPTLKGVREARGVRGGMADAGTTAGGGGGGSQKGSGGIGDPNV
jgi:hypothetical protein